MKRVVIGQVSEYVGSKVKISGFLSVLRDQKKMQFLVVKDRTGSVQAILEKQANAEAAEKVSALMEGSTVIIVGKVVAAPQVKLGGIEIQIENIEICTIADPLPVTAESSLDKRMDYRWVDLRRDETLLIFQVQTALEKAMRDFWDKEEFIEIHSPKLMGTASESGSELFSLDYFGEKTAYLAQSPQFYKQMAMAAGFERIFEIGPVYRANPSFTSRHDTEFTSVDMEISWIESHHDVMELEEKWLKYILSAVKQQYGEKIKQVFDVDIIVPETPFPKISLQEARAILEKEGHTISHKSDLDPEGERKICAYVEKEFGHQFVFITDYPTSVRPFYHMRHEDNTELTKSFDLLWQGLEITTGAQREHRIEILKTQAEEKGYGFEPLEDYFNFFRFGCPPHGGVGVGLTRLLMILLKLSNVREVTYLYRGPHRLRP